MKKNLRIYSSADIIAPMLSEIALMLFQDAASASTTLITKPVKGVCGPLAALLYL